jgi:hypothetical protein
MNLYLQKHFSFKSVAALAASIDILVFGHEFGQDTAAGLQYSIDIIHIVDMVIGTSAQASIYVTQSDASVFGSGGRNALTARYMALSGLPERQRSFSAASDFPCLAFAPSRPPFTAKGRTAVSK